MLLASCRPHHPSKCGRDHPALAGCRDQRQAPTPKRSTPGAFPVPHPHLMETPHAAVGHHSHDLDFLRIFPRKFGPRCLNEFRPLISYVNDRNRPIGRERKGRFRMNEKLKPTVTIDGRMTGVPRAALRQKPQTEQPARPQSLQGRRRRLAGACWRRASRHPASCAPVGKSSPACIRLALPYLCRRIALWNGRKLPSRTRR